MLHIMTPVQFLKVDADEKTRFEFQLMQTRHQNNEYNDITKATQGLYHELFIPSVMF